MNNFEEARDLLITDLRKYLLGPAEGDDELIPERASDRYHVGILAPSGTTISPDEDDVSDSTDVAGSESKTGDGVLALANATQQSAMGFTFQVPTNLDIRIDAAWADYVAEAIQKKSPSGGATEVDKGQADEKISYSWRRTQKSLVDVVLPLKISTASGSKMLADSEGIRLEVHERTVADLRIVTVSLVNRRPRPERGKSKDKNAIPVEANAYQVSLSVRSGEGTDVFVSRASSELISDPEFIVHELMYRSVRQFAVGHGCSTDWLVPRKDSEFATQIHAEWLPTTEVYKASSKVDALDGAVALDVAFLSNSPRENVIEALRAVPSAYNTWIDGLRGAVDGIVAEFGSKVAQKIRNCAVESLEKCAKVSGRISKGIDLLATDDKVYRSFALANAAMAESMKIARPGRDPLWRPFQLAFLLLAIPSTAFGDDPARGVLDLIWFPTGGGKTEAYLGLVAFTLFHRRLSGSAPKEGGGTGVITRYTLRLLTMQQFERAARAVMACEVLRRSDIPSFGTEPYSIGLFVGNSVTPKDLKTAQQVIDGTSEDKSLSTLPVAKCPWCSTKLRSGQNQKIDPRTTRLVTRCPNNGCPFHDGIPFACVDEELYANPPSMIIGTVDKFAMMAWEPQIGRLFGKEQGVKPPTLIIQDELHLIGDALGSVTGLYETAIDLLCTDGTTPPKIVGSTATIRRAQAQTHSVFLREVSQFPPSGLDYDNSFFYSEDRDIPGRVYLGVLAQGRSPKHTLARLMGILGQGANSIQDPDAQDHFWTLVTYFNSLRELGGAWVLGLDDVPKYIKAMPAKRGPDRRLGEPTELTSHVPSTHIPQILENLAASKNADNEDREPFGLLLCTNMISVGVDIDRLGLMIVNGQPKTTAEYIQASSRVGRPEKAAGLVVALYNWTRPRDRSHYERFRSYHESFYRNVESTSVTPFSMRARDRALHGVFVSLLRLLIKPLASSPKAIDDPAVSTQVDIIVRAIVARARSVSRSDDIADDVEAELEDIRDQIRSVANLDGTWKKQAGNVARFLRRPNEPRGVSGGWETPQSMRDVDPPCAIELKSI